MNGYFHYFLSAINPMSNLGFSRALPELTLSVLPYWWLIIVIPFCWSVLPALIIWVVHIIRPAAIRPPLRKLPNQYEPMVSVVIAGRNESATIGQCITAVLQCGYPNVEVIFVDDNSEDSSIAVAKRAALAAGRTREDAERVRIFQSPRRNGKASSLNIGIRMARGEFIVVHDADSVLQYGTIHHWLLPFADPKVGGVVGNIRVKNSTVNFLTRMQEVEYALKFSLIRYVQARLNILSVITGMGGIFRAEILHGLAGYDTGLGDDTDLTMMLRKQRWKLRLSLDAVVWTTVPETRFHLWNQRARWRRNMIKILVSKHRDQYVLGRFGPANAVFATNIMANRLVWPWVIPIGVVYLAVQYGPFYAPGIILSYAWIYVILLLIRALIARDLCRTPQPINFWLVFLYPVYLLWLRLPILYAEASELVRIGAKHPYIPDHVWEEIPWW
jgi:biofilm PGA synthesis N-glycosyltransferase PgaC